MALVESPQASGAPYRVWVPQGVIVRMRPSLSDARATGSGHRRVATNIWEKVW
jgi:hypothetical protein